MEVLRKDGVLHSTEQQIKTPFATAEDIFVLLYDIFRFTCGCIHIFHFFPRCIGAIIPCALSSNNAKRAQVDDSYDCPAAGVLNDKWAIFA